VEKSSDRGARRELVESEHFEHVWAVRGQPSTWIEVAVGVPQNFVDVPIAVQVSAFPGDLQVLLLRCRVAGTHGGRANLIRIREAGVVSVKPAQRVVDTGEPTARKTASPTELERVMLAFRFRH